MLGLIRDYPTLRVINNAPASVKRMFVWTGWQESCFLAKEGTHNMVKKTESLTKNLNNSTRKNDGCLG